MPMKRRAGGKPERANVPPLERFSSDAVVRFGDFRGVRVSEPEATGGWHCFRRSLASNLYSLGVKPKVIQAILRHSDIATTLGFYVETSESESREALDMLTKLMG
jgi:integrase